MRITHVFTPAMYIAQYIDAMPFNYKSMILT